MRFPRSLWIGLAAVLPALVMSPAAAQTNLRFSVGWAWQGDHSIWARAIEQGLFSKENLNVTMDRGYGASDTITKVAAGVYDIGFCDINALVKFNSDNPDRKVLSFFQVYNRTLAAVLTTKSTGIKAPKDLEGATLAGTTGEASRLMFPAFAQAAGFDASKVTWQAVAPQMREVFLVRGQVKAMAGFISTAYFNLKSAGIKEEDIVSLPYADFGLDLYGSGLIATQEFIEKNPAALKGFVRATIAAMRAQLADPMTGIQILKKRDPLLKEHIEVERLKLIFDQGIMTAEVKTKGFGVMSDERIQKMIRVNAAAYNVTTSLKPSDIITTTYLPPASERMP